MDKPIRTRDSYWDNLKGVLITLVVCGHLCEQYIDDSNLLRHLWIVVYSFHMPLFIAISGYLFWFSVKNHGMFNSIKKRVARLLPVCLT